MYPCSGTAVCSIWCLYGFRAQRRTERGSGTCQEVHKRWNHTQSSRIWSYNGVPMGYSEEGMGGGPHQHPHPKTLRWENHLKLQTSSSLCSLSSHRNYFKTKFWLRSVLKYKPLRFKFLKNLRMSCHVLFVTVYSMFMFRHSQKIFSFIDSSWAIIVSRIMLASLAIWVWFPAGGEIFLTSRMAGPALWPTKSPVCWVPGLFPQG